MDLRDFPFLDDPARAIGWGSYRLTEDEFVVACRAVRIATIPWYRSWPWAIAFFGLWHAAILYGLYSPFLTPRSEGRLGVGAVFLIVVPGFILWASL